MSAQPSAQHRLEVGFRPRASEIQIRFTECVDEGANDVRAADGHAAHGADVCAEPVEEYDLPIEKDDGDFGPVLGMRGSASAFVGR